MAMPTRKRIGREAVFVVLVLWAILAVAPFIFVLMNALKSNAEYTTDPIGPPPMIRLENFAEAIAGGRLALPFARFFVNSVFVTGVTTVLVLLLAAMAAYAMSRVHFPGVRVVLGFSLAVLVIPAPVAIIPIFDFMGQLSLRNNLLALIAVYTAFALPFAILIFKAFYDNFSRDIEDAARIDGCSEFGVFWRIVLPLSKGPMVGVGILTAIGAWGELLFALVLMSRSDLLTVTVGLMQFRSTYWTDWHVLFSGLLLSMLPLLDRVPLVPAPHPVRLGVRHDPLATFTRRRPRG